MRHAFPIALLSLTLAAPAWPQSSMSHSPPGLIILAGSRQEAASGVALIRRADFVSFSVTITSNETDLANRVKLIGEGRVLVTDALAKEPVRFETGTAHLVLDQPGKAPSAGTLGTLFSSGAPSFGSLSSPSGYGRANEVEVHVLVPLVKSEDNLFDAALRIATGLNKLQLPQRVSLRYSPFRLAVENPDRFRKELLAKVADQVTMIKTVMRATGKVNVSGLASPVLVRQVSDTDVELSLACAISIEIP